VRNTSYNRLMMAGKRELRIFMAIGRHLWTLHNKMERRREALPIAIVVGVHPLFSLGAQAFTPSTEDEYAVIGGMMNEPLRVVKAKTVPILVPADAELIIEGKILPDVRREEGPFGEFTGHAVSKDERPVIEVTAVTHRKNYIFQDVHAGYTEHKLMGAVPREAALIRAVRQTVPTVKNVCMPVSGNCSSMSSSLTTTSTCLTKNRCSGRYRIAFKPTKIWLSLQTPKAASSIRPPVPAASTPRWVWTRPNR
jgi:2,5-furandicarboxylate decarboxylase 1